MYSARFLRIILKLFSKLNSPIEFFITRSQKRAMPPSRSLWNRMIVSRTTGHLSCTPSCYVHMDVHHWFSYLWRPQVPDVTDDDIIIDSGGAHARMTWISSPFEPLTSNLAIYTEQSKVPIRYIDEARNNWNIWRFRVIPVMPGPGHVSGGHRETRLSSKRYRFTGRKLSVGVGIGAGSFLAKLAWCLESVAAYIVLLCWSLAS